MEVVVLSRFTECNSRQGTQGPAGIPTRGIARGAPGLVGFRARNPWLGKRHEGDVIMAIITDHVGEMLDERMNILPPQGSRVRWAGVRNTQPRLYWRNIMILAERLTGRALEPIVPGASALAGFRRALEARIPEEE
jgi:hypothetical protein